MNLPSKSHPSWPLLPVAAMLALAWAAFCWPWLTGAVTVPWDAKAHFYPQLQFLAQSLHEQLGYAWAPFVFSGVPQIADPQSLIFSLPHRLLAHFIADPGFIAADAVSFGALLCGSLAVLVYFRDRNWHPAGALVAGIAFALGGSAAWRIQHTGQVLSLAYFPIVLLLIDRALLRTCLLHGVAAGAVAALMLLGRDQVAGLSALIVAAYVLTHLLTGAGRGERILRALPVLIVAALVGTAILLVPLAMTAVLAAGSNRAVIDYAGAGRGSLHPASLITAFIANLYGTDGEFKQFWGPPSPLWGWVDLYIARNMSNVYSGALVALAIVFGAAGGGLWKSGARFFGLALLAMVLYALGRYTPFFSLIYHAIPGVDLFRRPADGTFLIGALAAYAAGHVVHVLMSGETGLISRAGRIAISLSLAAVLSAVALALSKGRLGYAWPMILEGALWLMLAMGFAPLAVRLGRARPLLAAALVGAVLTADLVRNNGPNESTALPPAMYDVLRPDSRDETIGFLKEKTAFQPGSGRMDRVELAAIDFHTPNASLVHRLHNTLGYNPVRDRIYTAAVGAGDHIALADQRAFPPLFPSYASPLANLLGLRYIATAAPIRELDRNLPEGGLIAVRKTKTATIYENPRALPRVMVVPRMQAANFDAILRTGTWPRTDFEDVVLLPEVPPGAVAGTRRGTARITRYTNTEISIEVDAPDGGYVVLNDPWHPWWYGYVNGYVAEVRRANVLFRAVMVPPGRHTVSFAFRPLRGLGASLTDWISGRAPQ